MDYHCIALYYHKILRSLIIEVAVKSAKTADLLSSKISCYMVKYNIQDLCSYNYYKGTANVVHYRNINFYLQSGLATSAT